MTRRVAQGREQRACRLISNAAMCRSRSLIRVFRYWISGSEASCGRTVLADGVSQVILAPTGPAALGFPTRIEVASGPFSAVIEAEAGTIRSFATR